MIKCTSCGKANRLLIDWKFTRNQYKRIQVHRLALCVDCVAVLLPGLLDSMDYTSQLRFLEKNARDITPQGKGDSNAS